MKREQWTVEYRNWIGASTYGLMFIRARKGSGVWRSATSLPEYVTEYLGLTKLHTNWCMAPVRSVADFGPHITHAARTPNRIHIDMPVPVVVEDKHYSPLTIRNIFGSESPYALYRATYKYTDCGPTVGFTIIKPDGVRTTVYSGELPHLYVTGVRLKTGVDGWKHWAEEGIRIVGLTVGSIVEGVEQCCETIEVPCKPLATLRQRFDEAVEAVNREANEIWNETHGCPECYPEDDSGYCPINPKCKACKGQGIIL